MPKFGMMPGYSVGTVYPIVISAPFGGLFADGGGGGTLAVCPQAKSRFEGVGRL